MFADLFFTALFVILAVMLLSKKDGEATVVTRLLGIGAVIIAFMCFSKILSLLSFISLLLGIAIKIFILICIIIAVLRFVFKRKK